MCAYTYMQLSRPGSTLAVVLEYHWLLMQDIFALQILTTSASLPPIIYNKLLSTSYT